MFDSSSKYSVFRKQSRRWAPRTAGTDSYKLHARSIHKGAHTFIKLGLSQCQATAEPSSQSDNGSPGSPDISLLSPELQQQWHVERNMHLGTIKVKPQSNIKAVWQCDKCPAGQPHIWTVSVANRRASTQCPYCSNRRVCLHNSLATVAPEACRYWNYAKNEKAPDQVLAGSNSRAEWQCPDCNWAWRAIIKSRVRKNSGCRKCSARNRTQQPQPTFAEAQPPELAQWNHERNDAEGFFPHNVTLGSDKQVHWICSCCPRGQPHRWTARPNDRVSKGQGCPMCDGKHVCRCNSLESLCPSIAAEFDVDKNGFAPAEVVARSHERVWWRNAKRGSWRQSLNSRTDRRLRPNVKQGGV
ncbi:hypothetical protein ABBQ38_013454 [Trebouxia sp. C0009 RCD-2024]